MHGSDVKTCIIIKIQNFKLKEKTFVICKILFKTMCTISKKLYVAI